MKLNHQLINQLIPFELLIIDMCVYLDFSTKDTDECSRLKPCSHECSNTAGGYRCSCPLGLTLNQDAKTCSGMSSFTSYYINSCCIGVGVNYDNIL